MIGRIFISILLAAFIAVPVSAQFSAGNLKELYRITTNDSLKLKALLRIIASEKEADSTLKYVQEALRVVRENEQAFKPQLYNTLCDVLLQNSMYKEAVEVHRLSAAAYHAQKKHSESATSRLSSAYILIQNGLFKEAIEDLTEILSYAEKYQLNSSIERSYLLLGFAYRSFDYERALKYFNLCLEKSGDDSLTNDMNYALNEIGNLYVFMGNFSKAEEYHKRALILREKIGSSALLSYSYHDIASCYNESGNYNEALKWFFRSEELTIKEEDWWGLAITYSSIAKVYRNKKAYASAESYLHKALELAEKVNMKPVLQAVYLEMYEYYQETRNFEKALNCYKQQKYYNDSIYEESKQQELRVLESRFESLQKDKEIVEQKEKLNQQRSMMYFGAAIIAVLLITGLYIYRQYLQKQRLNRILAEQNAEIESQRDEIASQRDEIASQRDQVIEQKNQIHGMLTSVTSSIRYAQTIQQAILPSLQVLKEAGWDYFLLFKPSEIVSGDFYWAHKYGNNMIVAVADCTGHGVPGAFMSMLGITLLKEIVIKEQITNPAEILIELRKEIIKALNQEKGKNQRDGMDIAVCNINLDTLEMQFAGANNPMYLVPIAIGTGGLALVSGEVNQQPATSNQKLVEIKGDKMPIGIYERMEPFTLHRHQLQKGDYVYLFSDGYADQFGGVSGKKFKYKSLKEIIVANANRPMSSDECKNGSQKDILENAFIEWKGDYKQVDDVTILGIKIG